MSFLQKKRSNTKNVMNINNVTLKNVNNKSPDFKGDECTSSDGKLPNGSRHDVRLCFICTQVSSTTECSVN